MMVSKIEGGRGRVEEIKDSFRVEKWVVRSDTLHEEEIRFHDRVCVRACRSNLSLSAIERERAISLERENDNSTRKK